MTLNNREVATVLAALRIFQANFEDEDLLTSFHFDEHNPLTPDEIDDLCERINMEGC